MATDLPTVLTNVASVYLLTQPSEQELTSYVNRVESGSSTLPNAVNEIRVSVFREFGPADELARLFFVLFGRSPDPVLYGAAMAELRTGTTLENLCALALDINGNSLSNAQNLSDTEFVSRLIDTMWVSTPAGINSQNYVSGLQTYSRAHLLSEAIKYTDASLKYVNKIEPSLIYLAAAQRQITAEELEFSEAKQSTKLIREALVEGGADPYGTTPYWNISGSTLYLEGLYEEKFSIDLTSKTISLGDQNKPQIVVSRDDGGTESFINFETSLLNGVTRIDARETNIESADMNFIGAVTTRAGASNTTVEGSVGNDRLEGGSGNDILKASAGSDILVGGGGGDTIQFGSINDYALVTTLTTVTDFGVGADKLDFSVLFGTSQATNAAVIAGVGDPASTSYPSVQATTRKSIILVEHAGTWPSAVVDTPLTTTGSLTARTAQNIADLFANTTLSNAPTRAEQYIVISTDVQNDADIWLIENSTKLTTVEVDEIKKIGHVDSPLADLYGYLATAGNILS